MRDQRAAEAQDQVTDLKAAPARAVAPADLDWLAAHRVGCKPMHSDAGSLVSGMLDDDER